MSNNNGLNKLGKGSPAAKRKRESELGDELANAAKRVDGRRCDDTCESIMSFIRTNDPRPTRLDDLLVSKHSNVFKQNKDVFCKMLALNRKNNQLENQQAFRKGEHVSVGNTYVRRRVSVFASSTGKNIAANGVSHHGCQNYILCIWIYRSLERVFENTLKMLHSTFSQNAAVKRPDKIVLLKQSNDSVDYSRLTQSKGLNIVIEEVKAKNNPEKMMAFVKWGASLHAPCVVKLDDDLQDCAENRCRFATQLAKLIVVMERTGASLGGFRCTAAYAAKSYRITRSLRFVIGTGEQLFIQIG